MAGEEGIELGAAPRLPAEGPPQRIVEREIQAAVQAALVAAQDVRRFDDLAKKQTTRLDGLARPSEMCPEIRTGTVGEIQPVTVHVEFAQLADGVADHPLSSRRMM